MPSVRMGEMKKGFAMTVYENKKKWTGIFIHPWQWQLNKISFNSLHLKAATEERMFPSHHSPKAAILFFGIKMQEQASEKGRSYPSTLFCRLCAMSFWSRDHFRKEEESYGILGKTWCYPSSL